MHTWLFLFILCVSLTSFSAQEKPNTVPFSTHLQIGEEELISALRQDIVQQSIQNKNFSPGKSNRPIKLKEGLWQCPISHEILYLYHFSDLPNIPNVDVFYSPIFNVYWTRLPGSEETEIWGGKFQFGPTKTIQENSLEEQPSLEEAERFILNVMVDKEDGGTGFFENQFLGIKDLGPKTLDQLHLLILDHLHDTSFQALCCRAMGELGDKRAIPLLKEYLNDAFISAEVQQEAIYTLAELGDRSIIDRLIGDYLTLLQNPQLTPYQKITVYTQLATMYYRLKEFDKSIECYQQCIQISPNEITHYNLACMYAKLGQVDKAIENIRLSIEKGYDEVEWMKKDGDLDKIREDPRFIEMIKKLEEKQQKENTQQ